MNAPRLARSLARKVNLFFAFARLLVLREARRRGRARRCSSGASAMTAKRALRPRQGILDIAPYVPGKSALEGDAPVIKLSSNETPFGPSPAALEAYAR